jgi:hypothetical protein
MTWTNEEIAGVYGGASVIALALSVLSRRDALIKFAMVLLFDWAVYNVIVNWTGYERAPLLIPMFDAAIGIWVGIVAWANSNLIGAMLFALFVAVVGWWAIELWDHAQATYLCYLVANMVFAAQVAIVGVAGGWTYMADRRAVRDRRVHPHPVRS